MEQELLARFFITKKAFIYSVVKKSVIIEEEQKGGMRVAHFERFERWVSTIVDIMLGILVILILIVMGEAIYTLLIQVIPLKSTESLSMVIEEVATLFILLEIILMLLRYVKEGHHIPVRYLILISITAILRELLLSHDGGIQTLFFSLSILVLVVVLLVLEKIKAFHADEAELAAKTANAELKLKQQTTEK